MVSSIGCELRLDVSRGYEYILPEVADIVICNEVGESWHVPAARRDHEILNDDWYLTETAGTR